MSEKEKKHEFELDVHLDNLRSVIIHLFQGLHNSGKISSPLYTEWCSYVTKENLKGGLKFVIQTPTSTFRQIFNLARTLL